jgi:hypothetical protein
MFESWRESHTERSKMEVTQRYVFGRDEKGKRVRVLKPYKNNHGSRLVREETYEPFEPRGKSYPFGSKRQGFITE